MINSFKGDLNFANNYTDAFAIGIMAFYFLMVVPFVIALGIHIYKGTQKLAITRTRTARGIMMTLFIVFSLTISVTGFYLYFFFYYGFAP